MVKFLVLVGLLILMLLLFGFNILTLSVPALGLGVILAYWYLRRGATQSDAVNDSGWFVEESAHGNRFMIGDPLDLPGITTEQERQAVRQDILIGGFQMSSQMLALRHRILNEDGFLATPEGIESVNAIGGAAFDLADAQVTNWKTNDFRQLGIELLLA